MSFPATPDFSKTVLTVSLTNLLSAFSQESSPQNSSSMHLSKYSARGPFDSLGPTIAAVSSIVGGVVSCKVCFPNLFI